MRPSCTTTTALVQRCGACPGSANAASSAACETAEERCVHLVPIVIDVVADAPCDEAIARPRCQALREGLARIEPAYEGLGTQVVRRRSGGDAQRPAGLKPEHCSDEKDEQPDRGEERGRRPVATAARHQALPASAARTRAVVGIGSTA